MVKYNKIKNKTCIVTSHNRTSEHDNRTVNTNRSEIIF